MSGTKPNERMKVKYNVGYKTNSEDRGGGRCQSQRNMDRKKAYLISLNDGRAVRTGGPTI